MIREYVSVVSSDRSRTAEGYLHDYLPSIEGDRSEMVKGGANKHHSFFLEGGIWKKMRGDERMLLRQRVAG